MPCARLTPPTSLTTRVISRMTDSVNPCTRFEIRVALMRDPPVVGLHVGAPDVDDEVEVLDEAIHDRLLDQLRGKRQPQAYARHREQRLNGPRRWRERSRPDRRP